MRLNIFLNFIVLFSSISIKTYSQNKEAIDSTNLSTPTIKELVQEFNSHYSVDSLPEYYSYELAKMPNGIFVYEKNAYETPQVYKNFRLFWDKNGYKELDLPEKKASANSDAIKQWEAIEFNFNNNLYFGYPTWGEDVIKELGNKTTLTDTQLFSLGSAYSRLAASHISPHFENQERTHPFDRNFNIKDLPSKNISEAVRLFHLSYQTYGRLKDQNPLFETIIGNSGTKQSCEAMNAYLEFSILGLDSIAKTFLYDGLFDNFYISIAKNFLSNCPKDAVLFTGGDMDTYPLIYAQDKLNFRKDVTVVNLSLANLPRYINYLSEHLTTNRITHSLPLLKYRSKLDYFYNQQSSQKPVSYAAILNELNTGKLKNIDSVEVLFNNHIFQLTTGNISVKSSNSWGIKNSEKTYTFNYDNYIILGNLYILNIIENHNAKRPIIFSNTLSQSDLKPYKKYLRQYALVYQLLPTINDSLNNIDGETSCAIFKSFSYKGFNSIKSNPNKQLFAMNYSLEAGKAAKSVVGNNPTLALELADLITKILPDSIHKYSYDQVEIGEVYYLGNEIEKGDRIFHKICENAKALLSDTPENLLAQKDYYAYACQQSLRVTQSHNRKLLAGKFQKLLDKYLELY